MELCTEFTAELDTQADLSVLGAYWDALSVAMHKSHRREWSDCVDLQAD